MSDSNLKRKRDKDGGKKSSKKTIVDEANGASTVKVSLVEDRDDWAPLVGMLILTSRSAFSGCMCSASDKISIDAWSCI